ncbi:DUF4148 domain-containing protein [Noviherbaspirillum massiliense]|uniref:DUF4148 domain-containing protein n=1 Tax=Noviherbaspirillum massiliense TaxID=1465823 RepID=UPI000308E981|nr:DUF4148 domain-containing protein [Noviherbaspirillum massiliense]
MNAKKLIAVAALAATGSAFAGTPGTDITGSYFDFSNVQSTKSRAEVRAEAVQANGRSNKLSRNNEVAEPAKFAGVQAPKTRAEVRAELEQAYAQGELNKNNEYVDTLQFATASHKTRDEVRNEVTQLAKDRQVAPRYVGGN